MIHLYWYLYLGCSHCNLLQSLFCFRSKCNTMWTWSLLFGGGNLYLLGFELSFAEISCPDQPKKRSNESRESKSQHKELLAEQINEILHKVNEGCKFTAVRNLQCDMQKPLAGKSFLHDFIKFFTLELSTLGRLKKKKKSVHWINWNQPFIWHIRKELSHKSSERERKKENVPCVSVQLGKPATKFKSRGIEIKKKKKPSVADLIFSVQECEKARIICRIWL